MTTPVSSPWKDAEVEALGELAAKVFANEVVPHHERFEGKKHVDCEVWLKAGPGPGREPVASRG